MSKFISSVVLFLACAAAFGQYSKSPILSAPGAPSGGCAQTQIYVNSSNGDLYSCSGGTWVKTGSGGGAGTVTSVTFTGDGTVLSSTPSAAVTTSGTLTAALASAAAGTLLGNSTGGAAAPTYGNYASYGLATLASPTFTGTPAAPTAAPGTSTTQLATTAFVATSFAPLASPTLTGTPLAPTAAASTNTTQIATTAFVHSLAAYSIQFSGNSLSPAVSGTTPAYFQGMGVAAPGTAQTGTAGVPMPVACTITAVSYQVYVAGTKDTTTNNFTLSVYNDTTSTNYTATNASLNAQTTTNHSTTVGSLSQAVALGDRIMLRIATPAAYGTPPTTVYYSGVVYCQP